MYPVMRETVSVVAVQMPVARITGLWYDLGWMKNVLHGALGAEVFPAPESGTFVRRY